MRGAPLLDRIGLSDERLAVLREAVGRQRTLGDVLTFARTHSPPAEVVEIVTQDEYTHDVMLAVGAREERIYLAYDTT